MQRKHTRVKAKAATVDTAAIFTHALLFALLAMGTMLLTCLMSNACTI
ncbi:MAG: hypothetical protein IT567_03795 [Alphaproteobacteria bacterium]|nr:hypothetical protein [Alphaproteobacteria bacterium]